MRGTMVRNGRGWGLVGETDVKNGGGLDYSKYILSKSHQEYKLHFYTLQRIVDRCLTLSRERLVYVVHCTSYTVPVTPGAQMTRYYMYLSGRGQSTVDSHQWSVDSGQSSVIIRQWYNI